MSEFMMVAFIDVNEPLGKELKAGLAEEYGPDTVEFYVADVSSKEEFTGVFQKIVDRFGHIDIMYNNAGILNENDWENTIAINMVHLCVCVCMYIYIYIYIYTLYLLNFFILSTGLWFVPTAPIYRATKYAVVGFSRAVAMKSNLGVRINILCPGVVKTNLLSSPNLEDHFGQFSELEGLKEMVLERNDFEVPDDVAKASLILVTDESKNREILKIDADGMEFISLPEPCESSRPNIL
uniref:15-hydroxyprostaglandin dehydrogenase n=1 Tax=Sinocyclocheilus anshuiensis TaxID=1608454 RepID=A0A671NRD0_9TELE